MTEQEFEELLHKWGRVYGERPPRDTELAFGGSMEGAYNGFSGYGDYGVNPIAVAMEHGSRNTKETAVAYHRPRRSVERGIWRDPTPCRETRHYRGALYFAGAEQSRVDPMVVRVERAACDLFRIDTVKGLVLRAQYCTRGLSRVEKAAWVTAKGCAITARTYSDVLPRSRDWVHGRITA